MQYLKPSSLRKYKVKGAMTFQYSGEQAYSTVTANRCEDMQVEDCPSWAGRDNDISLD